MAQIRWLSKLILFDVDIKYGTAKSNKAADGLHCHPKSNADSSSNVKSEEYETILYEIVSEDLTSVINGIKLPIDIHRNTAEHP